VYLVSGPIDPSALLADVSAPDRGGVASFLGVVRDHHAGREVLRLEYSAYPAMAELECEHILAEARGRWPCGVTLRHRLGTLEIGDLAVAVLAASAHRAAAFDACRYVIEQLKRRVPIWKREFFADGTDAWVDPTAASEFAPSRRDAT